MRLLAVRGFLAWRNGLDAVARLSAVRTGVSRSLTCALLRRVDYRLWLKMQRRLRWGLQQRRFRHRQAVAEANRQSLLGDGRLDFAWLMQRRQWLDLAAIQARNAALMEHLAQCTSQLNQVVEPLHRAGVPVLLAPMHTVSDVLATLVGAGVYPGRATVIVSGDAQTLARRAPEGNGGSGSTIARFTTIPGILPAPCRRRCWRRRSIGATSSSSRTSRRITP